MVGLPGAGKSFFARQFSETFAAPVVSIDRINHELFAEPQYVKEEQIIIGNIALYQIEELAKTKRTFLIDGGANTRLDRAELIRIVKRAGYDVLLIWVQTDLNTCRLRALKRNPHKTDDQYNRSLPQPVFDNLIKTFGPPSVRENYIVISGKHTYATQARVVLRKLAAPRAEVVQKAPLRQIPVSQTDRNRNEEPPRPIPPTKRSVTIH